MSNTKIFEIKELPKAISEATAIEVAYGEQIRQVAKNLSQKRSTLVMCDREIIQFVQTGIRDELKRNYNDWTMVIADAEPDPNAQMPTQGLRRVQEQIINFVREIRENYILSIPYLDLLTSTTQSGLGPEAREGILYLHQNDEAVFLGFCDPALEIPEGIKQVFPRTQKMMGIDRKHLHHLITQREAKTINAKTFNAFGLYSFVSGANVIRARRVLSGLVDEREATPKENREREIYKLVQQGVTDEDIELPNVDFDKDIAGYKKEKDNMRKEILNLRDAIDQSVEGADAEMMEKLLPKGIVLWGPPGTGKTYFAKAIATYLDASIIIVSGPELKNKWVGASEENIRKIFARARANAPCVVVFDEIDSMAPERRNDVGSGVENSMVNQLLTEMDGFRSNESILFIATTNKLNLIDGALLRPGRFELKMEVPGPTKEDRLAILKLYDKQFRLKLTDELLEYMVEMTEFPFDEKGNPFAGDHLKGICRILARTKIAKNFGDLDEKDVEKALDQDDKIVLTYDEQKRVAVHECGHAIAALLTPEALKPKRISIKQEKKGALGYVLKEQDGHASFYTGEKILAAIDVMLAGREAERIVYGNTTPGAGGDYEHANHFARMYVIEMGATKDSNTVVIDYRFASEAYKQKVEEAVEKLLHERIAAVSTLLQSNLGILNALTEVLMQKKVMQSDEIKAVTDK